VLESRDRDAYAPDADRRRRHACSSKGCETRHRELPGPAVHHSRFGGSDDRSAGRPLVQRDARVRGSGVDRRGVKEGIGVYASWDRGRRCQKVSGAIASAR
jgi:hypothetical protein